MKYITAKQFKRKALDGNFNIPYGTDVDVHDGFLWYDNKRVYADHSAVMRKHFAANEDGLRLCKFEVAHAIIDSTLMRDGETKEEWQKRWNVLWADATYNKYYKDQSETTFLWSIEFYSAPSMDLYHIAALADAKI